MSGHLRMKKMAQPAMLLAFACTLATASQPLYADVRDPFEFGSKPKAQQSIQHMINVPTVALGGILWDPAHPLAMVGDEMVGVGDMVGGWLVVEIKETGITLEGDGRRVDVIPGSNIPPPP